MTNLDQATAANTPKTCECFESEYRDPKCKNEFPTICPWWELQLTRHITGRFPPLPRRPETSEVDPLDDGSPVTVIRSDPTQRPSGYERKRNRPA